MKTIIKKVTPEEHEDALRTIMKENVLLSLKTKTNFEKTEIIIEAIVS